MNRSFRICLVGTFFMWDSLVSADVIHVPGDFVKIQAAIDAAASGDEVVIAPGTHLGLANRDLDFAGKAITVRSTDPTDPDVVATTIIDCQQAGRGFIFQSGETLASVVDGLTIVNGFAVDGAGVYLANASSAMIRNCVFSANTVPMTSGVIHSDNFPGEISDLAVIRCTITNNIGGGFASFFIDGLTITESIISQNTGPGINMSTFGSSTAVVRHCLATGNGGDGMVIQGASIEVSDCLVAENGDTGMSVAGSFGGAGVEVSNCTVTGNTSDASAGGLSCHADSPALIRNCLVAGNSGVFGGMAISGFGPFEIRNCTLSGNVATFAGGGIHAFGTDPTDIRNCILWGNSAPAGPELALRSGFNNPAVVSADFNVIEGGEAAVAIDSDAGATSRVFWSGGNIESDPLFVSPVAGDYHLAIGSPSIDAGDPAFVPQPGETDLGGHPRVLCGRVDMGAYEFGIGDFDCDRVVDLTDFASWSACVTGPDSGPYAPGCEAFDAESDGDVDLGDFAEFQEVFREAMP